MELVNAAGDPGRVEGCAEVQSEPGTVGCGVITSGCPSAPRALSRALRASATASAGCPSYVASTRLLAE